MTGGFFLVDFDMILFLMFMGFIAAFIDAIVGGGGLIGLPALLWTGISPVVALGTNKVAAVMGALTSFVTFIRSGKVNFSIIKILFPLAFIGSLCGVVVVRQIPPDFLRPLVIMLLIGVTIYSLLKKDWGEASTYDGITVRRLYLSGLIAFLPLQHIPPQALAALLRDLQLLRSARWLRWQYASRYRLRN